MIDAGADQHLPPHPQRPGRENCAGSLICVDSSDSRGPRNSTQGLSTLRMIVTSGGNQRPHLPHPYHCHDLQARLAATGTTRELLWVGVADGLDAKIDARSNIPFRAITTGRLRRSNWPATSPTHPGGIAQAAITVARVRPTVVVSTGGYVSVSIAKGLATYGLDPAVPLVPGTGGAADVEQINRMLAGAFPRC